MGGGGVAGVARLDIGEELAAIHTLAAGFELAGAAVGAHGGIGDDEELGVRFGRDHRADIAAIEDGATGLRREIALEGEQRLAHAGKDSDAGGQDPHLRAEQEFGVHPGHVEQFGGAGGAALDVGGIDMGLNRESDGAVEQARIEVGEVEMPAQGGGDGALARGGRTIDGDDHAASSAGEKPAPRRAKSASKLGKLVMIIRSSSTWTGFSEAKPMTRKLMAMR